MDWQNASSKIESWFLLNISGVQPGQSAILGDNQVAFYTIHYVAISLIITSLVSCFLLIISILCCSQKEKWNFADRFPFYLAIADVFWGISHLTDHLVLATTLQYPSTSYATGLSLNLWFFLGYQQMMHAGLATYTYLKIVRGISLNLGKGEWKLHAFCAIIMLVSISVFYPLGSFGCSGYWFLQDVRTTAGQILGFYIATSATIHAICTTLGYRSIKRVVEAQRDAMLKHRHSTSTSGTLQSKTKTDPNNKIGYHSVASECLTTFVQIALALYVPLAIAYWAYSFQTLFGFIEPFTSLVIVIVANSSGWANSLGYLHNNKIKAKRQAQKELLLNTTQTSYSNTSTTSASGSTPLKY